LKAKLGRANAAVKNFGTSVMGQFRNIALSFAGAFAVTNIIGKLRGLVDEMDKIGKAADKLGVSTKIYQEMALAAELSGVTMERFKLAMSAMGPFMLNAATGTAKYTAVLERLNLRYDDLAKLKPEQQFKRITGELDKVANATERVGLARAIFGRAGLEVLGMARNYELAREKLAGSIISRQDIAAAEKFNDELKIMEKRLKAMAANAGWVRKLANFLENVQSPRGRKDIGENMVLRMLGLTNLNEYSKKVFNDFDQQMAAMNKQGVTTERQRDILRKQREEEAAGKNFKKIYESMTGANSAGGGTRERFDQFRRIGSLGGFGGGGVTEYPVLTFLEQWGPLVRASVEDIARKTPEPNEGGRY
jgi:hypothetical protein